MEKYTPITKVNEIYVKRDDFYKIAGVCGGKARSCWHLAQKAVGLVSASSRHSPQLVIVAHIAHKLGIPCNVHTPTGKLTNEMWEAKKQGCYIAQHIAGYNNVIISRAKFDADISGWTYIPFGMECEEAVEQTATQVINIPQNVKRIVISVGSGMSLAGLLTGLKRQQINIPVLGIIVGADPIRRLYKYAPLFWQTQVTLVKSTYNYDDRLDNTYLGDILLDPIYEAKCLPHLEPEDLFWIVGRRNNL